MTISVPKLSLVVLVGPSRSGKSMFARKHFRPTEVLSSDACLAMVSDDENNQAVTSEAFAFLYFVAAQRLALGRLTVVDNTIVQTEARAPLVALARKYYCLPVAVVLNLPEEVCRERNRSCPDRSFGPHVILTGDGKTKNDHFADMPTAAHARGFRPHAVLFDGWYASVGNLKTVRGFGRIFVTRFEGNRQVRIDHGAARAVEDQPTAAAGTTVWLPGFGAVNVFRVVAPNGGTTHWATNDLGMDESGRLVFRELSWSVKEYHRGLKPFTGVERCQVRAACGQRNHIGCAIRAFVRLECHCCTTGVPWFKAKWSIVREAVRNYLPKNRCRLPAKAAAQVVDKSATW